MSRRSRRRSSCVVVIIIDFITVIPWPGIVLQNRTSSSNIVFSASPHRSLTFSGVFLRGLSSFSFLRLALVASQDLCVLAVSSHSHVGVVFPRFVKLSVPSRVLLSFLPLALLSSLAGTVSVSAPLESAA